jgi:16S rRNA (guanine(966)-N(2))-methyltransferase RsmD
MRVISGKLGGQTFDSPRGHRTHPMSDKIRGALFNMLGNIDDLTVADLFAGTGAISIEAISRGAARSVAIEADKVAYTTITHNIEALKLDDQVKVHKMYVHSWLNRTNDQFDIVVADPPYDDLVYKTLDKLPQLVKPGGIIVYSLPPNARLIMPKTCELISDKNYGDATLVFYRKIA